MFNLKLEELSIIIAVFAIVISVIAFWYNSLRKGNPIFYCSRWTAIGLSVNGEEGAAFSINIGLNNNGNSPIEIIDFILVAETHHNKKIFYDPIILFDLTYYISSIGQDRRIENAQKGQIPLPIIIPPNQQYTFEEEILFMPYDKKTAVLNKKDPPFTLKLYALTDRYSDYKKIAEQNFEPNDIEKLVNGSFSGVLSTYSIKNRERFINRIK